MKRAKGPRVPLRRATATGAFHGLGLVILNPRHRWRPSASSTAAKTRRGNSGFLTLELLVDAVRGEIRTHGHLGRQFHGLSTLALNRDRP